MLDKTPLQHVGVDHFHQSTRKNGLSEAVASALLSSVTPKILVTYGYYWKKFVEWTLQNRTNSSVSLALICDFILFSYNKEYKACSLNVARSSLNLFLIKELGSTTDPYILRLFIFFYRKRPIRPKYVTYWPISALLNFLAEWHPSHSLTL